MRASARFAPALIEDACRGIVPRGSDATDSRAAKQAAVNQIRYGTVALANLDS
jgi:hypothetical protein